MGTMVQSHFRIYCPTNKLKIRNKMSFIFFIDKVPVHKYFPKLKTKSPGNNTLISIKFHKQALKPNTESCSTTVQSPSHH